MQNGKILSSDACHLSSGWYLGLRYMQGTGLIARVAEPIEDKHRGAQFIFADQVLCRVPNWRSVLADWWDALAVGGHLILWLPDCRHHEPEQGAVRLTLDDAEHALDDQCGWQLCEADLIDGHIYIVWRKHADRRRVCAPWRKQPKHVLVARTGAHGDALMAASVLPWLKEQGFAVSFISRETGIEVLKHDPHIDEMITLNALQASDEEMPYYWQAWARRFDRFINLTYSVEGELLKQPARPDYFWPDDQRRRLCGRSYLRHMHKIAVLPGPCRVRFYPDVAEKAWAMQRAQRYGRFVLWCLRGSSVHKWWPHAPQAVCQLLARTNVNIVLTGDAEAAPLAENILKTVRSYYGDDHRVHALTGTNSIREIMTLAHFAAAVVGPETGVMNAVSLEPVPKVLLLSHSATVNLSDDWVATTALTPATPCYPCHRLHYSHDWCPQDTATGAAACAASISAERVVQAVRNAARGNASQPWWMKGEVSKRAG